MFEVGDKVRFVTTEPEHCAMHCDGEMTVEHVYRDGNVELRYPKSDEWPLGLHQTVSISNIEKV